MTIRLTRFNLFFWLLLAGLLGWGCQTDQSQKKAPKKGYNLLRLHLEVNPDGTDKSGPVTVGQLSPFTVNVQKAAFVDEAHLARASVVDDDLGGFKMRIQLNRQGSWLLEQYTLSSKGKRIAVFAELDTVRWLAAPIIAKGVSDGVLTFTPDATREEAEKLALGLNKIVKKLRSQNTFNEPESK